ncbi:MAG: hypothetical protein M1820_002304 [Bogoriella megaspora]|nr:MAG: hypothetical protein M1820_002304 [Bogoriella megaspora]
MATGISISQLAHTSSRVSISSSDDQMPLLVETSELEDQLLSPQLDYRGYVKKQNISLSPISFFRER